MKIKTPYTLDTVALPIVGDDNTPDASNIKSRYSRRLSISSFLTPVEVKVSRRLAIAIAIATRGAHSCVLGIAAIDRKNGVTEGHVAADGSVTSRHPELKKSWADVVGDVLSEEAWEKVLITSAKESSGLGP